MSADPFTTAARTEAERRHFPLDRPTMITEQCAAQGFVDGASWARDHQAYVIILAALTDQAREHWEHTEQDRERHNDRGCSCDLCQTLTAAKEARA